eukprot:scaffold4835_cov100-Skeletonema_marinoi.AAC.3
MPALTGLPENVSHAIFYEHRQTVQEHDFFQAKSHTSSANLSLAYGFMLWCLAKLNTHSTIVTFRTDEEWRGRVAAIRSIPNWK